MCSTERTIAFTYIVVSSSSHLHNVGPTGIYLAMLYDTDPQLRALSASGCQAIRAAKEPESGPSFFISSSTRVGAKTSLRGVSNVGI